MSALKTIKLLPEDITGVEGKCEHIAIEDPSNAYTVLYNAINKRVENELYVVKPQLDISKYGYGLFLFHYDYDGMMGINHFIMCVKSCGYRDQAFVIEWMPYMRETKHCGVTYEETGMRLLRGKILSPGNPLDTILAELCKKKYLNDIGKSVFEVTANLRFR